MTAHAHALAPTGAAHSAFKHGKLVPGFHDPLVQELERIAAEAGITVADVTGELYHLTDFEREYLTGFRRTGKTGKLGLIYIGAHDPSVTLRERSVCGALIRNFIPARLIVREELVSELFDKRRQPDADLVAIPDLSYADAPASTRRAIGSWLMGRMARGRQTVIGVPNKAGLNDIFGAEAPAYTKHFSVLNGVQAPG